VGLPASFWWTRSVRSGGAQKRTQSKVGGKIKKLENVRKTGDTTGGTKQRRGGVHVSKKKKGRWENPGK